MKEAPVRSVENCYILQCSFTFELSVWPEQFPGHICCKPADRQGAAGVHDSVLHKLLTLWAGISSKELKTKNIAISFSVVESDFLTGLLFLKK